jgi:hypothetical protein
LFEFFTANYVSRQKSKDLQLHFRVLLRLQASGKNHTNGRQVHDNRRAWKRDFVIIHWADRTLWSEVLLIYGTGFSFTLTNKMERALMMWEMRKKYNDQHMYMVIQK